MKTSIERTSAEKAAAITSFTSEQWAYVRDRIIQVLAGYSLAFDDFYIGPPLGPDVVGQYMEVRARMHCTDEGRSPCAMCHKTIQETFLSWAVRGALEEAIGSANTN